MYLASRWVSEFWTLPFMLPWQSFYQPSHLPSPKPDLLAYFLGMDIHTIANSSFSTNDISIGTPVLSRWGDNGSALKFLHGVSGSL